MINKNEQLELQLEKINSDIQDIIYDMKEINDGLTNDTNDKILAIVMKYANKHKDMWGISEYVAQDDNAMVDAIDLFGEIIGNLKNDENLEDNLNRIINDLYTYIRRK